MKTLKKNNRSKKNVKIKSKLLRGGAGTPGRAGTGGRRAGGTGRGGPRRAQPGGAIPKMPTPRNKNGNLLIYYTDESSGETWVLLQIRSTKGFLPDCLGAPGGQKDDEDQDSRYTAIRECAEESGITIDVNNLFFIISIASRV